MKRRGGSKLLNIPVSLFTGLQATILPWIAFNGDRDISWVFIPLSLYTTWIIVILMQKRGRRAPHIFLIVHLIITTLYLPGIFTAYNPYAVISIVLSLIHLYIEYFTRRKRIRKTDLTSRVYRNKRRAVAGKHLMMRSD